MLREIYMLLKQRLVAEVTELKHIDWHLQQLNQEGDEVVRITPGAFISFRPIQWENYRNSSIQRGVLQFDIHLITDTAYGDDRDMTDTTYINHLAIEQKIYKAMSGWRGRISMIPEFAALNGTNEDVWLLETIIRTESVPHNLLDMRVQTSQLFQCTIFDYAALPQFQETVANLNISCV